MDVKQIKPILVLFATGKNNHLKMSMVCKTTCVGVSVNVIESAYKWTICDEFIFIMQN